MLISLLISKLVRSYRVWAKYHREVRELSQLSDRELTDIGVSRSQITAIAWQDAHR